MRIRSMLSSYRKLRVAGFTLTELLVAMLCASILIAIIFTFTTNLMQDYRKQEAKVETEEEITAALNYIAGDLQEAVFIYGGRALELPHSDIGESGIADQIPFGHPNSNPPAGSDRRPVLAFWKRVYFEPEDELPLAATNNDISTSCNTNPCIPVKCLGTGRTTNCFGFGRNVYSLVVYYLVKDNDGDWSDAVRLSRWEIKDGIKCPAEYTEQLRNQRCRDGYEVLPDRGFRLFSLTGGGTVEQKMNRWTKDGAPYNFAGTRSTIANVLIDHLDDTPYGILKEDSPLRLIPVGPNRNTAPINPDCDNPSRGVGVPAGASAQRTPSNFRDTTNPNDVRAMTSFVACVANYGTPSQSVARVWLRGAAYSRYLPRTARGGLNDQIVGDIRVLGRGLFNLQE